jgi:hypothetical protein
MALLIKNQHRPTASTSQPVILDQWIKVSQPAVALPATTTGQLFRVRQGRVLVRGLLGEVTTIIQTQACNTKISSKKLDNAGVAVGTAVDVASNLDITAIEVGGFLWVEGDGTALVKATAGASLIGSNSGQWIAPQGEIYVTTAATNTGAVKWDIWYMPIDPGAFIEAATLTTALLTAAI